jgi:hypothetical protein
MPVIALTTPNDPTGAEHMDMRSIGNKPDARSGMKSDANRWPIILVTSAMEMNLKPAFHLNQNRTLTHLILSTK